MGGSRTVSCYEDCCETLLRAATIWIIEGTCHWELLHGIITRTCHTLQSEFAFSMYLSFPTKAMHSLALLLLLTSGLPQPLSKHLGTSACRDICLEPLFFIFYGTQVSWRVRFIVAFLNMSGSCICLCWDRLHDNICKERPLFLSLKQYKVLYYDIKALQSTCSLAVLCLHKKCSKVIGACQVCAGSGRICLNYPTV